MLVKIEEAKIRQLGFFLRLKLRSSNTSCKFGGCFGSYQP